MSDNTFPRNESTDQYGGSDSVKTGASTDPSLSDTLAVKQAMSQLGISLETVPLPDVDVMDRVEQRLHDESEKVATEDYVRDVGQSVALDPKPQQLAAFAPSVPDATHTTIAESFDSQEVNLVPAGQCFIAASSDQLQCRMAEGHLDGAAYSLTAIVASKGNCVLRVAGPAVANGRRITVGVDDTDRTGLLFDRYGFAHSSGRVAKEIWEALVVRRHQQSPLKIRFRIPHEGHDKSSVSSRAKVWAAWEDFIDDADKGPEEFINRMNDVATASSDAVVFGPWCQVICTEILEAWLFQDSGFAKVAAASGFSTPLLDSVLSTVFRRRLLSLRSSRDTQPLVRFWKCACQLLLPGDHTEIVELFNSDSVASLVANSRGLSEIAADEETFAKQLDVIAKQLSEAGIREFAWALDVLLHVSAERRKESLDRPAVRVVAVWVPGVLSSKATRVLRPGLLLDFDLSRNKSTDPMDSVFSRAFRKTLDSSNGHFWQRVRLVYRDDNNILSLLGTGSLEEGVESDEQGTVDGESGSLSVHSALDLAARFRMKNRTTQGFLPFVVGSAREKHGRCRPVLGLPEKLLVLREEGVRVLFVADTQRIPEADSIPSNMIVTPVDCVNALSTTLTDNDLTGPVLAPRSRLHPAWLVAAAAALLVAFWGWRISQPDNSWQTEALAYHQRVGSQQHAEVWGEVKAISKSHDGNIAVVPLMRELNILTQRDKVGVDPRFLASLLAQAHPDLKRQGTPIHLLATSDTKQIVPGSELDIAAKTLTSDEYEHRSERDAIIDGLASALGVENQVLEIRVLPVNDLTEEGTREILYDGKVFDHVGEDGRPLWRPLLTPSDLVGFEIQSPTARNSLEHLIKTRPVEAAFFTRLIKWNLLSTTSEYVSIELNTSGYGVIPVLERGDVVSVYVKSMPQSQWRPLHAIPNLADVGLTITTILQRPIDVNAEGITHTDVKAIYVNAFQDQSVRGLVNNEIKSDWWGARFQRGTVRGDLAVAFPASSDTGPQGGQNIDPELGFQARDSESGRYDPINKDLFRAGPRNWIVPDGFVAGQYWDDHPNALAAVIRFRAHWPVSSVDK